VAHKGKIWKLWFRRDASWSLNNYRTGYPEAYYVRARDAMVSTRWDVSSMDFNVGVNLNKTFDRRWTSEPRGGVFDNSYWSIEVTGPADQHVLQCRFRLTHSALVDTPLFSATYTFDQTFIGFENIFLDQWDTLHFLNPDIHLPSGGFRVFLEAARYARYNP